jgi:hypothetical protein
MRIFLPAAALLGLLVLAPAASACAVQLFPTLDEDVGPVGATFRYDSCPMAPERYVEVRVLGRALRWDLP